MNNKYLILVAGGIGSRIKSDTPKQFIKIHSKPVIVYSLEKFLEFDPEIIIVIVSHKDYIDELKKILNTYLPSKSIVVTEGGETRFHSVKNGLKTLKEMNGLVAVHDAARPMVSLETIKNCFSTAAKQGNAIPVVALNESLRFLENNDNKKVNRANYKIVQTPQCFNTDIIKAAFEQNYSETFTDDASVLENFGYRIFLVDGNPENIKITTNTDLIIATQLLK